MESLYGNVGKKIKKLAFVDVLIFSIGSIFFGLAITFVSNNDIGIIIGLLIVIIGPLVSFISSLTLYGFGELIEKACEIAENTAKINIYKNTTVQNNKKTVNPTEEKQKNDSNPKNKSITFYELLKNLPKIKSDTVFVEAYANDADFQAELAGIDDVNLQLKFIDLAYEFCCSEMSEEEWENRKLQLFEEQ